MPHWTPRGSRRGRPPPPQPYETNNVVSRLVRIETYLQGSHEAAISDAEDSLNRDYDLSDRLNAIEVLTGPVSATVAALRWAAASTKFLAFSLVVALWINGAITWGQLTAWVAGVLGLPIP